MKDLIRDQLKKVKVAIVPKYDDSTTELLIRKSAVVDVETLQENRCYIIKVADYIINPPEGFDLHVNWNNNIIPPSNCMKCMVLKIAGKMIKIQALAYDLETNTEIDKIWIGWLPRKSIIWISEV